MWFTVNWVINANKTAFKLDIKIWTRVIKKKKRGGARERMRRKRDLHSETSRISMIDKQQFEYSFRIAIRINTKITIHFFSTNDYYHNNINNFISMRLHDLYIYSEIYLCINEIKVMQFLVRCRKHVYAFGRCVSANDEQEKKTTRQTLRLGWLIRWCVEITKLDRLFVCFWILWCDLQYSSQIEKQNSKEMIVHLVRRMPEEWRERKQSVAIY